MKKSLLGVLHGVYFLPILLSNDSWWIPLKYENPIPTNLQLQHPTMLDNVLNNMMTSTTKTFDQDSVGF